MTAPRTWRAGAPGQPVERVNVADLVLAVRRDCDRARWDDARYERYLDALCGDREYQKDAIRTLLRYLLGGEYGALRDLARENWDRRPELRAAYPTWAALERRLQLPDHLSATVDLATGTGKTYVMFGVAQILLAEGAVDRVLVLCPSTTIEQGLLRAFRALAADGDLAGALPADAKWRVPHVQQADAEIEEGAICVENRDAVYAHVRSSIFRLKGLGARTAVLNDEAHHVANDSAGRVKLWKQFLADPAYGFRLVVGFSGTCYVDNTYFADVVYRFSLRRAIEEHFTKTIRYLHEMPRTGEADEEWQHALNVHEDRRRKLKARGIRPLSLVVTASVERCKAVAEAVRNALVAHGGLTAEQARDRVLVVYNGAPDVPRLVGLDDPANEVEWVVSVSMLTEGWDVKRVFQIIPHEERAFNSKLLIAQVLGRGLRVPDGWSGPQPEVTVLNHANWSGAIRELVNEILEMERRLTARVVPDSPFHFELHNVATRVAAHGEARPAQRAQAFAEAVELATEAEQATVHLGFETVLTPRADTLASLVRRRKYTPEEVAQELHATLVHLDMESADGPPEERTRHAEELPLDRLLAVVQKSLGGQSFCTDDGRQRLRRALNAVRQGPATVVRFRVDRGHLLPVRTADRPDEHATASQLTRDRVAFVPAGAAEAVDPEQRDFLAAVTTPGGLYRHVDVANRHDLKSPVTMVFADAEPERQFLLALLEPQHAAHVDAWIKSTPTGFYAIDYAWRKNGRPKRGQFNPDFFLARGDLRLVVEVKDDGEYHDPSPETVAKAAYAREHFAHLNAELEAAGLPTRYAFTCVAPVDLADFFAAVREERAGRFRSKLDIKLREAADETAAAEGAAAAGAAAAGAAADGTAPERAGGAEPAREGAATR